MIDRVKSVSRRLAPCAAVVTVLVFTATPAHAGPLILPLIEAAVLAAGLPATLSVFGLTIGTASLISAVVTTSIGRGLHFGNRI